MGYLDWHKRPGYWADITRHFDPQLRVLDLGCGSAWLGEEYRHYVGVDGSIGAATEARLKGIAVAVGDLEDSLPFADQAFDGVVLKDVLEHIASPAHLIREVHRVLRPGGRVFASSPDAQRWVWDDYTHRRPFTRKSFRRLFEDQGFSIASLSYESVMPGTSVVSRLTRRNRRPRALSMMARVPGWRRNVWTLAIRDPHGRA